MNLINKLTMVLSKVFEVVHWIGAGIMALFALFSVIDKTGFGETVKELVLEDGNLLVYGLDINPLTATGEVNTIAVTLFCVAGIIAMILMAMLFRNVNLIFKTVNGKNKKATNTSPFQKDIIRMVKEIGYFSIAIPVVGFIFSVIITAVSLISGVGGTEIALNFDSFILGIICLSLSNIFTYGANLEKDVDGLL